MIPEQNKRKVTEVAVQREEACTSEPPPHTVDIQTGNDKRHETKTQSKANENTKNASSFDIFNTRVTCTHEEEKKTLKLNISKL